MKARAYVSKCLDSGYKQILTFESVFYIWKVFYGHSEDSLDPTWMIWLSYYFLCDHDIWMESTSNSTLHVRHSFMYFLETGWYYEFYNITVNLLQEGGPHPGPETGLLSNTRKWIVWGDTHWQSRRFYWEGRPGGEQEGKGTQENCSAVWLAVSGFMVMGLVSGWSLANHSISGSFLVVHALLSQDGCWWEGFWEVDRHAVSPFHLSQTSGWWWLISSVFHIRISCHKTTHANGYYGALPGWAVSISVLPLTNLPVNFCMLTCLYQNVFPFVYCLESRGISF